MDRGKIIDSLRNPDNEEAVIAIINLLDNLEDFKTTFESIQSNLTPPPPPPEVIANNEMVYERLCTDVSLLRVKRNNLFTALHHLYQVME